MNNYQQRNIKKHYERILSAKGTIRCQEHQRKRSVTIRTDPMKTFQLEKNNKKIAGKLLEIYGESYRKERRRKNKKKKSDLVQEHKKKEQDNFFVKKENEMLLKRIHEAHSSVRQNWKERENTLRIYRDLRRKRTSTNQQEYFDSFRKQLVKKRKNSLIFH